jgi:YbbR domain-containing protein
MKAVNLTISGRQRQIKLIEPDEVVVRVNLKGLAAGKHKIRLTGKNVDLPSGVKVDQITPQSIEITLPAGRPANQSD